MKTKIQMHAVAKAVNRVPVWMIQMILGILLTGSVSWATWSTKGTMDHDRRISVVESQVTNVKDDIKDIKDSVKLMSDKLDRVLERGNANGPRPKRR